MFCRISKLYGQRYLVSKNLNCSQTYGGNVAQIPISPVLKSFKTSNCQKSLPSIIRIIAARVAKFGAVWIGRTARNWWQKLSHQDKRVYYKRLTANHRLFAGVLGVFGISTGIWYSSHVQETPLTGRKRFLPISIEQFNKLSKYALDELMDEYKGDIITASMNYAVYSRIVHVTQKLLNANQDVIQIHEREWTITVVDNDKICNAFVLSCGSIFIFTGLLKLCQTNDELGIILGHEMSHAILGHGAETASKSHLLDLILVIPLGIIWAILPTDVTAALGHAFIKLVSKIVLELPHSRLMENEADKVGLILASKACFDIREAPILWRKSLILEGHDDEDVLLPEWFSTHPSGESRSIQVEKMLPEAMAIREGCQCPKLPPPLDADKRLVEYSAQVKEWNMKHTRHDGFLIPVAPQSTK